MLRRSRRNHPNGEHNGTTSVADEDGPPGSSGEQDNSRPAKKAAIQRFEQMPSVSDIDDTDVSGKKQVTAGPLTLNMDITYNGDFDSQLTNLSDLTPLPSPTASESTAVLDRDEEQAPEPPIMSLGAAPSFIMQPGGFYHISAPPNVNIKWWERMLLCTLLFPVVLAAFVKLCALAGASYEEFRIVAQDAAIRIRYVLDVLIDSWLITAAGVFFSIFLEIFIPVAHILSDGVVWGVEHAAQFALAALLLIFVKVSFAARNATKRVVSS